MPLHFLVRGDLFNVRWLKPIMIATNQIPIYRFKDGFSGLRNNRSSFAHCHAILKQRKHILIFPEGSTEQVRHLRPLRKGTARLVFSAMERHPDLAIDIVPVSIHFTEPSKFRGEVMVRFGEALHVQDYWQSYQRDDVRTSKQLTDDIATQMRRIMVDLPHAADVNAYECASTLMANNDNTTGIFPIEVRNCKRTLREGALSSLIRSLPVDEKHTLHERVAEYTEQLRDLGCRDRDVHHGKHSKWPLPVALLLGFVPFLLGVIGNALPMLAGKAIADSRVREVEFYTSVRAATSMVFYMIYWLIVSICGFLFFGRVALWLIVLPFLGLWAIVYLEKWRDWKGLLRMRSILSKQRGDLDKKRTSILHHLDAKSHPTLK